MGITVFLAEYNPVFMKGLATQFQKEKYFTIVTPRESSHSPLDFLVQHQPDLFVYDIDHNGEKNGFPMLREIRSRCGDRVRVIAITDCTRAAIHSAFFHFGGDGYVLRNGNGDEIASAFRAIVQGKRYLSPDLGATLSGNLHAAAAPPDFEILGSFSPKRKAILPDLAAGDTLEQIAAKHNASIKTADGHRQFIMNKLDVHCQAELRLKLLWLKYVTLVLVFLFGNYLYAYAQDTFPVSRIDASVFAITIENNFVWCASDSGVIRYDKFNGEIKRYTTNDNLSENGICSVAVDNEGVKWFGTNSKGVLSFDGKVWTSYYQKFMEGTSVSSIAVDKNNIKYFSFANGVYTFDGNNWILYNLNHPRKVFLDSDNRVWIVGDNYVLLSDNTGLKEIVSPYDCDTTFFSITEDHHHILWFGCIDGIRSFDGKNWSVFYRDQGVDIDGVNAIAIDRNGVKWLASFSGLFSFDGRVCKNYTDYEGRPGLVDIKIDDDGVIWAAGSGLYSFRPDSSTGVSDSPLLSEFHITGVYPNPFNPSTTISFSLPSAARATIAVYDITGRKVRTLVSGSVSAGNHSVVWDGRDASGRVVSSGVYFARLESGNAARTMKMLLMR